jgi:hypothetical protein
MPIAVVATQHPLVSGPHDEVLTAAEQDALFARKAKSLGVMLEEMGRYLSTEKKMR